MSTASSPKPPSPESPSARRVRSGSHDLQEMDMSTIVKHAVQQARKSSRSISTSSHPQTPTGLVIKTSEESSNGFSPNDMDSPSLSEMDQLLAPTYESGSIRGSSVGTGTSICSSDDIIRKVEMEIANARKAATEAHARLADAMSKSIDSKYSLSTDPTLDDLDFRKILLSTTSADEVQDGTLKGKSSVPLASECSVPKVPSVHESKASTPREVEEDGVQQVEVDGVKEVEDSPTEPVANMPSEEVLKELEDGADDTDKTDPAESTTSKDSSVSEDDIPMQTTFESAVELPLEAVVATLGINHSHHEEEAPVDEFAQDETTNHDNLGQDETVDAGEHAESNIDLTTDEAPNDDDDDSDYTEETASDGDSEYTEETVYTDDEGNIEDPSSVHIEGDEFTASATPTSNVGGNAWWTGVGWFGEDQDTATSPDQDTATSPDQDTATDGSRTFDVTGSEAITSPGSGFSDDLADPSSSFTENVETTLSFVNRRDRGAESKESPELENKDPALAILVGPKETTLSLGANATNGNAEGEETKFPSHYRDDKVVEPNVNGEAVSDEKNTDEPVLKNLAVNAGEVDLIENGGRSDVTRVQFRYPYPTPPLPPVPRPASEIISDNLVGGPTRDIRWTKPKPELEELLLAVKGDSMARRSNACGALKVLLSKEKKNVFVLVRTIGFLESLVFACKEDVAASPEMETAIIARGRAITTIMKVCELKENRALVMSEPGLPECLVKTIQESTGEARAHACSALAMLAKTPLNRESMVKVDGLVAALARVVDGSIDPHVGPTTRAKNLEVDDSAGFGTTSFSSGEDVGEGSSQEDSSTSPRGISPDFAVFSSDSIRKQKDEKQEEFEKQSKVNSCAVLMHLSKHCSISDKLCGHLTFMDSMVTVSRNLDNPLHTKCLEILCNITRFPSNNAEMARDDMVIDTLVKCGKSKKLEDRVWALRALQNIASDSASKVILAKSRILTLLSICAMRKDDEQHAAVAALYNLSTEPGAVVPLTNTKNVVATLVHLAHNAMSPPEVRKMSCEALATIGLWLQTLAGSGTAPVGVSKVLLPTHRTTGWERWD